LVKGQPGGSLDDVLIDRIRDSPVLLRVTAVVLPLATAGLLFLLRSLIGGSSAALILVLVVVAMAATGDRVSGALAALSSAIGFDFFVASPRLDFDIDDVADVEMAILLLLVGIAVSELALRGRRQQAAASERSGYLSGVLESAELAARGIPISDAIPTVAGHIWRTLGAERVTYEQGVPHRDCAIIQRDGTVTLEGDPLDVTRDGLPADRNTAVLVVQQERVVGHFLVAPAKRERPRPEQLRVAVLLADQIARRRDVAAPGAARSRD